MLKSAPAPSIEIYTVSQVTRVVRRLLEQEPRLQEIMVRGELANFRRHSSGHLYFTLKDEAARLRCVMFRSRCIPWYDELRDGLEVVVAGSIGVYEAGGEYQLYAEEIFPAGRGALYLALEQLKARLAAEGLFDPGRKRPLPRWPRCIGVVTSLDGAALRDIITVSRRRWPGVHLVISPALVQGEGAPESIVQALWAVNALPEVDVIILGRGGGSAEELWSFNDERVVRAICASRAPVISAVGHETDFTLSDLAADLRAATPSAAAELAVPDCSGLKKEVVGLALRLRRTLERAVIIRRERLARRAGQLLAASPLQRVREVRQRFDELVSRQAAAWSRWLAGRRERLALLTGKLEALSPLRTLERGYSVCRRVSDGRVVREFLQVDAGEEVEVILARGALKCSVRDRRPPAGGEKARRVRGG